VLLLLPSGETKYVITNETYTATQYLGTSWAVVRSLVYHTPCLHLQDCFASASQMQEYVREKKRKVAGINEEGNGKNISCVV
jgi:hypothetical protein